MNHSNEHNFWFFVILLLVAFGLSVFIFNKNKEISNFSQPSPIYHNSKVYTVFYTNGVFSPTNLQINIGDTVRFNNDSFVSIRIVSDPHPQHNDLPGFDSVSDVLPQSVFSFKFIKKGIFGYHNEKNPSQGGTIIVK